MKLRVLTLAVFVLCLLSFISDASAQRTNGDITLVWEYPADEMGTNLTFLVFHSTDITVPLTNWVLLRSVVGTNLFTKLTVIPGRNFFAMKATNFWSESDFSEVASTPALPRSDVKLRVTR